MAIANRLETFLKQSKVDYILLQHPHSSSSMETAEKAHIPGGALAKAVIVKEANEFQMVVIPSDYHLEMYHLRAISQRNWVMAVENDLAALFPDCELGAIPPISQAYGLNCIWDPDSSLGEQDKIYFEAGDHEHLVCIHAEVFHELMADADRGHFSHPLHKYPVSA